MLLWGIKVAVVLRLAIEIPQLKSSTQKHRRTPQFGKSRRQTVLEVVTERTRLGGLLGLLVEPSFRKLTDDDSSEWPTIPNASWCLWHSFCNRLNSTVQILVQSKATRSTMISFNRFKKFLVVTMAIVAVAANLVPDADRVNAQSQFASRYPMRARTPDFFARSTNNPSARYSGTIKPSNAKTSGNSSSKPLR